MAQKTLEISTSRRGLHDITREVLSHLENLPKTGLLNLFIQHTSASLTIQENADPTAKADLEAFLDKIAPDGQSWHRHTLEGPDDTTSHMKSVLTSTSLNIPIVNGELGLGRWQGIYLWEHRTTPHTRKVTLTTISS